MKLPLALIALLVLVASCATGWASEQAGREATAATAELHAAVQHAAEQAVAVGADTDYDDAVRVGPALVPVRVAVRTARGGAADGHGHSTVRATGPGGVPVVASATVAR